MHITRELEEILAKSGIREGMMLVSAMHITAGIIVNDNESGTSRGYGEWLEKLAPADPSYRHHRTGEDTETPT